MNWYKKSENTENFERTLMREFENELAIINNSGSGDFASVELMIFIAIQRSEGKKLDYEHKLKQQQYETQYKIKYYDFVIDYFTHLLSN